MAQYSAMTLPEAQRAQLRSKLRPEGYDGSVASRAQIVLWHDEGRSVPEIAAMMGTSKVTVYKWLQRYQEGGLAALETRKSTGRPREISGGGPLSYPRRHEAVAAGKHGPVSLVEL